MPAKTVLFVLTIAACDYDARFDDCAIQCSAESGCPDSLVCGAEGLCRLPGQIATCAAILGDAGTDAPIVPPSCAGLPAACGPTASDDCCSTATPIPGGTFYRSYDVATDGMYPDMSYPATVSSFMLDKYEVTVGRFRKFVEAGMGTQANPPIANDGTHPNIPNSGWDPSWNASLAVDTAALVVAVKCSSMWQSWTDAPGANENLPMNCITWYEAFAFCAWDGGFLPTEAEWNYAAAGGDEQRAYPWSSPAGSIAIDCTYANYAINVPSGTFCVNGTGAVNRVGSESPKGDGRWGHADLAGNAWEWLLDYLNSYSVPCDNCAYLTPTPNRVFHGGGFDHGASYLRGGYRNWGTPNARSISIGVRCMRPVP